MKYSYRPKHINYLIVISTSIFVISFWLLNGGYGERKYRIKDSDKEEQLKEYNDLKTTFNPDDKNIMTFIREFFMLHPNDNSYRMRKSFAEIQTENSASDAWLMYDSVSRQLFESNTLLGSRPGFFVEAGALDGEYLSNTLNLEVSHGWFGLLVEPDPQNFELLKMTNRKALMMSACFSVNNYPESVNMKRNPGNIGNTAIVKDVSIDYEGSLLFPTYNEAQCFPVTTILKAANVSHVDFFSLDVENVEEKVLENFPFDDVTVDVWAIEHKSHKSKENLHSSEGFYQHLSQHELALQGYPASVLKTRSHIIDVFEDQSFIKFMVAKGYYYFDSSYTYLGDYVFVRRQSKLFARLRVPYEQWNRAEVCKYKPLLLELPYFESNETTLRDPHHYPHLRYRII